MLRSLIIYDNKSGNIIFQKSNDFFSKNHLDLVLNFLKAIESFSNSYSGEGADVFQTKTIRITFSKSLEFNLTFAYCTDLSSPISVDKEKLETIKYSFIHNYWELFTSKEKKELSKDEIEKFNQILEKFVK
ncbi:MAG: hypothetical protein ACTSYF_14325 [Promethearchaeota archaeon]